MNMKNLLSFLAFDRFSIEYLLKDIHKANFSADYPLFYKNPDRRSAIDLALDRN